MRRSRAKQSEEANCGWKPSPNTQKGYEGSFDAKYVQTTRLMRILDCKQFGPFTVGRRISPYAYALDIPTAIRIHLLNPVFLLDWVVIDRLVSQQIEPPAPVEVDGKEEYQVSTVEDSWMNRNQLQYLIHWSGYDCQTWELAKFVDGCKQKGSFISDIPISQDLWTMFTEDLEPRRGILSQPKLLWVKL